MNGSPRFTKINGKRISPNSVSTSPFNAYVETLTSPIAKPASRTVASMSASSRCRSPKPVGQAYPLCPNPRRKPGFSSALACKSLRTAHQPPYQWAHDLSALAPCSQHGSFSHGTQPPTSCTNGSKSLSRGLTGCKPFLPRPERAGFAARSPGATPALPLTPPLSPCEPPARPPWQAAPAAAGLPVRLKIAIASTKRGRRNRAPAPHGNCLVL